MCLTALNIRRQHVPFPVLIALLAACSAASQLSASEPDNKGAPAVTVASRAPGDRVAVECNAPPDSSRTLYIIGYGSLMQDESRQRTSPNARSVRPVEVTGYRRGWFARGEGAGFGTTYLGAVPERDSRFNAVIYQVDAEELLATDRRERSYCRVSVALRDVKPLGEGVAPDGQVWIYLNRTGSIATPDSRHPIVQSYVDVFVSGCLEQEQRFGLADFSQQCLSTTTDWSEHWVNDRIYPRRPFIFQPQAGRIDTLLSRQLREYFVRIRIESGG